jgi:hypothetical protein
MYIDRRARPTCRPVMREGTERTGVDLKGVIMVTTTAQRWIEKVLRVRQLELGEVLVWRRRSRGVGALAYGARYSRTGKVSLHVHYELLHRWIHPRSHGEHEAMYVSAATHHQVGHGLGFGRGRARSEAEDGERVRRVRLGPDYGRCGQIEQVTARAHLEEKA